MICSSRNLFRLLEPIEHLAREDQLSGTVVVDWARLATASSKLRHSFLELSSLQNRSPEAVWFGTLWALTQGQVG